LLALGVLALLGASAPSGGDAQTVARDATQASRQPYPIRITTEELEAQGGVPRRWRFLLPPGDSAEGRRVFVAMECFTCHRVASEEFPAPVEHGSGPDLTGVGVEHPPEYLAESIVNPNRVIVLGPGYTGWDSLSKMPSYAERLTVSQLADVVAYLQSLKPTDAPTPHGQSVTSPPR
jgi:mono/diheme cytochrome c family protein